MTEITKIDELTQSELVKTAEEFRIRLHKDLCLGQTRYVCRYGTLSDGHEKLTPAQRYYQAIREMYHLAQSIKNNQLDARLAEADLIEAQEKMLEHLSAAEKIRTQVAIDRAQLKLQNSLTHAEDLMRQLDEFNNVRLELKTEVEAKYPNGIEQAEPDNWAAVARYRYLKGNVDRMDNIPMSPEKKAELGFEYKRQDMIAPLIVGNEPKAREFLAEKSKDKLVNIDHANGIQ